MDVAKWDFTFVPTRFMVDDAVFWTVTEIEGIYT